MSSRCTRVTVFALLLAAALAAAPAALAQSPVPRRSPNATRAVTAPQAARRGFEIKIIEPADGAIIMGPSRISVRVKADDTARIARVTFYVDDQVVFVDTEAPYQTLYDFGSTPRRTVVKAVATHTAGYSVETSVVTRELKLSYSVEVRRVVLTVTVTGPDGMPVTGLSRENFRVFEDGTAQEILEFDVEERPLRLALVLDTSGSMRGQLTQVQLAAAGFLDVLLPEDRAMVVDFDDQVMLLQDLTGDRTALRDALMSTFARGGTAMYDAIHATLRRLAPQKERKAIVLLSDGGDTASVMDKDNTLQATRASDVLIYAIGIGGADHSVLKSISREAGGRAYFVGSADELAGVYQKIADELRHQYIMAYASTNPEYDGKWRKLQVEFRGKGDYKVRFRRGYYAVRSRPRPLDQPPVTEERPAPEEAEPDPQAEPDPESEPHPQETQPDPEAEPDPEETQPDPEAQQTEPDPEPEHHPEETPPGPDPEQQESSDNGAAAEAPPAAGTRRAVRPSPPGSPPGGS